MASIRKRAKADGGGYQVRYYGPDEKARAKTFKTKKEAIDFSNEVEASISRGSWTDPTSTEITLADFLVEYLQTSVHWRPSTRLKVEGHVRNYIEPAFGAWQMSRIAPADVRRWVLALTEHGIAPGTVRGIYSSLSRVMKQASVDGVIDRSPCYGIALPQDSVQRQLRFLEAHEVDSLVSELEPRYRTLVYTAAYTGMRWGELAALKVRNVDLIEGVIHIKESVADVNGKLIEGKTKTGAIRKVSVPPFLRSMLAQHLAEFPSPGYVFTSAEGAPLRKNFYNRHFIKAVAAAGLPKGFRFHDLRHTCAALLIGQGAHPKEIQERLGHSTIRMTFDRYGHLFPSLDDRLRDGLEEVFQQAKKGRS